MTGVNGARVLTYKDFCKALDSKGNFEHRIINLAVQANEMLDDISVVEANDGTQMSTTMRTETPTPVWTMYYGGVPANKGSRAKVKVSCGTMATKIVVDKNLYDEAKDKDAVLEDEISAAQDGMRLEMGNTLIYGLLRDNPLGFNGLMKTYCAHGADDDRESAHYVINAFGSEGGSSSSSEAKLGSILLVGWSPNTITCFHPMGHKSGGIDVTPKRTVDVVDAERGGDATYEAYVQYLRWTLGLAVRDYRFGGRICNIQRDAMTDAGFNAAKFVELIDRLCQRVHDAGVRQAIYMDKLMWEQVCVMYSRLTRGNAISFSNVEQRKERRLYGIPVRIQDCMKAHEDRVPAFVG